LLVLGFTYQSTPASAAAKEIVIPWTEKIDAVSVKDRINRRHINANDSVPIRVSHFNFFHYSLKFTGEERTIESSAMLDRLWSQLFRLAGPLAEADRGPFETAVVTWRRVLANADAELADYTRTFAGQIALTPDECDDMGRHARPLGVEASERLEALRREALDGTETSDDFDVYERVLAQHRAVVERLSAFVRASDVVAHRWVEPLGKKQAASVVTLAITPLGPQGAATGQPLQESYFVRSTRPLQLHVGYSASPLKDLQFDRVRSATGKDLFLATKTSETTSRSSRS
jgi:hypothetical protein